MSSGDSGNLILTGFMGTGKTVIGREVARRLGRPFVDMDAEIEARAQKSIARIFAEDGETVFRQMEAALCQELSTQQHLIIATGGGTLVPSANRAVMMRSGAVVCLTCAADEILRRVNATRVSERPLLGASQPRDEIERLLKARSIAYASFPWQLDTTHLSIEQAAERVVDVAGALTLCVRFPGGEYPVHIGEGLLAHIGGALRAVGLGADERVAVVSNPVVAALYLERATAALASSGLQPFACSIPDGEGYKNLAAVSNLYDQFLAGGLDRSGTVLALGGGVTGDVAGYAAATYMRGVRFAQVPTTLLAMVDASVGGKVGVDLPQGKNLVGAFKQPALVLVDPDVLATLPAAELHSGMAEVIKHAVIGDADLFVELEAGPRKLPFGGSNGLLARAMRVKIAVVEQDVTERGRRAVLNLGHTIGHALELLSRYALRHGEAVAVGLAAATRLAVELGKADVSLPLRIERLLSHWGLPTHCPPFYVDDILLATTHDKKRRGPALRWALPYGIGDVRIVEAVPPDLVRAVLIKLGAKGPT